MNINTANNSHLNPRIKRRLGIQPDGMIPGEILTRKQPEAPVKPK